MPHGRASSALCCRSTRQPAPPCWSPSPCEPMTAPLTDASTRSAMRSGRRAARDDHDARKRLQEAAAVAARNLVLHSVRIGILRGRPKTNFYLLLRPGERKLGDLLPPVLRNDQMRMTWKFPEACDRL